MDDLTVQVFINTYNSAATSENLCKLLHHYFDANYVAITWNVCSNYWYVSSIFDNTIDNTGWILSNEPTYKNLPIKPIKAVKKPLSYSFINSVLFIDKEIPNNFIFYIQTFINKLRYEDLLHRNKLVQAVALSNISHSVRTPINGILHLTQDSQTDLKQLNQSVMTLANNLFDILDQTKVELNRVVLNKSIINFKQIIASVIEIIAENIPYHIDDSVPEFIYNDPHRIKQILIILIKNAIQHSVKNVYLIATSSIVDLAGEYQHNIKITIKNNHNYENANIIFAPLIVNCDGDPNLRVSYLLAKLLNGYVELKETCFEFSFITRDEEPVEISNKTLTRLRGKTAIIISESCTDSITSLLDTFEMKYTVINTLDEYYILYANSKFDAILCDKTHEHSISQILQTIQDTNTPIIYIYDGINTIDVKLQLLSNIRVCNNDINIMVVEDELINRIVIEKILKKIGYNNIKLMPNGIKALKEYDSTTDLVLIDIRMPGMTGFELANAIHQINPNAKMIGITAQTVAETDLKPWFKEFVYKPINANELKTKIHIILT